MGATDKIVRIAKVSNIHNKGILVVVHSQVSRRSGERSSEESLMSLRGSCWGPLVDHELITQGFEVDPS